MSSLALGRNAAVQRAIDGVDDEFVDPVPYPGAARDRDTGVWISDIEVAEVPYTSHTR